MNRAAKKARAKRRSQHYADEKVLFALKVFGTDQSNRRWTLRHGTTQTYEAFHQRPMNCVNCGAKFNPVATKWVCPWCGYRNHCCEGDQLGKA